MSGFDFPPYIGAITGAPALGDDMAGPPPTEGGVGVDIGTLPGIEGAVMDGIGADILGFFMEFLGVNMR